MPSLPNAPLIETVFELRWGQPVESAEQPASFNEDDSEVFTGEFRRGARDRGFTTVERPNPPGLSFPHLVTHRFRRAPDTWPCYQIGLGLFTANQVNDGYGWGGFKAVILDGLELLDKGHPHGLKSLPPFWVELRYRDGFRLAPTETPADFIANKLTMSVQPPSEFLAHQTIERATLAPTRVSFEIDATTPQSTIIVDLMKAQIQNDPGFVMDTIVRSMPPHCPPFELGALSTWLDAAHDLQKHAFETLIAPEFAASFQQRVGKGS
jgi:uncharacterized protein (TIGR04255 family)